MASPNGDHPTFAMLTNGDDIVFVKLESQHYGISQVLAPLANQRELSMAWQILRKIAETLTPSPSPKTGEGNKKNILLLFSRSGRRYWGMRAVWALRKS